MHRFPVQTSLYAASKLACEGFIHAYCEGYGFEGYIFRFVSILGERYTHGHVLDFYKQLLAHPDHLKVLGDGTQRKSYLYIGDCLDGDAARVIAQGTAKKARHRVETYNLGTDEYVQVNDSIRFICSALGLKPKLEYSGGNKGWVGDNPFIFLDTKKIRATGWKTTLTIEQGIVRTLAMAPKKPVGAPTPMNLVITGSSSGIGKFLADSLAAKGPCGLPPRAFAAGGIQFSM